MKKIVLVVTVVIVLVAAMASAGVRTPSIVLSTVQAAGGRTATMPSIPTFSVEPGEFLLVKLSCNPLNFLIEVNQGGEIPETLPLMSPFSDIHVFGQKGAEDWVAAEEAAYFNAGALPPKEAIFAALDQKAVQVTMNMWGEDWQCEMRPNQDQDEMTRSLRELIRSFGL